MKFKKNLLSLFALSFLTFSTAFAAIPLPTTPEERLQLKLKVRNARRKAYPDPDAEFS